MALVLFTCVILNFMICHCMATYPRLFSLWY